MGQETSASGLISIFGSERFRNDPSTLSKYATSIGGTTVQPCCVVYPIDESEIIALLKLSKSQSLKLFTISRGRNFGYGEAQGTDAGQVIVDLSRMNRIVEVNETLAYATIQPGVSQQNLFEHLQQNKSRLQLDITGAGLDASIVGNILERGFGHTDYGDRFARVIRMTAILADGSVVKTGFGSFDHANARNTYKYGIGPMLDGLLSQSNFCIITEMTFELMPKPEKTCMFIVSAKKPEAFAPLVDSIRELKLDGVVNSAVHFANKSRAIGQKENKLAGYWNMSGSISGPVGMVNAKKSIVRAALKKADPGATIWFVDQTLMRLASWVHRLFSFSLYTPLKDAWDLQMGVPTDNPLKVLLNDESLESATINTASYDTGFIWINAVCAADGRSANALLQLTSSLFKEHGYEFPVTFTAINPRSLIMITNINYPRNEESIAKAHAFSKRCHEVLIENGFLPYRSGSGAFDETPEYATGTSALLRGIKNLVDPGNILAPGKYRL
ncbi:MAG: hypothetical protein RL090_376 [Bacteroidota bacterium]